MPPSGVIRRFPTTAAGRQVLLTNRGAVATDAAALPEPIRKANRELFGEDLSAEQVVARVLADVREKGDGALLHYTRSFDRAEVATLRVTQQEIDDAAARTGQDVLQALEAAAQRIRDFHLHTRRKSWIEHSETGGSLGQLIRPLDRVAVYAPGGRAAYPSTVLMAAIPAQVAGVREIVLASPPGPSGDVTDVLLAAAKVAGITEVYRVGGAQAIAALAYGTESVRRVDKIVGPGNLFVVIAKRMVWDPLESTCRHASLSIL